MDYQYEAGIWQQGEGLVVWSRHRTERRAVEAARRYARRREADGPPVGGLLSWAGGWRQVGAKEIHWVRGDGSPAVWCVE